MGNIDISTYEQILSEFGTFPKPNTNQTFMDICQLGGDRFEERCSRIWKFFFDPKGPHNLRSLFITSLLEVLDRSDLRFSPSCTNVITEEMTDDEKFIDITIVSDSMVIAIENKIYAPLYNPLCSYAEYINKKYQDRETKLFVVLSVKSITKDTELQKMKDNEYIYIRYDKLFEVIKRNLGYYALDADPSYLTFLLDFIRTIENRYYIRNMELTKFFFENRESIDSLIWQYDEFNKRLLQKHNDQLQIYRSLICPKTQTEDGTKANKWWIYQGCVLGIYLNEGKERIGIECVFKGGTFQNQLGDFYISIATWGKNNFNPYKQDLEDAYPDKEKTIVDNRAFLPIAVLTPDNPEAIIDTLSLTYNTLKDIVEKHK